MKHFMTLSDAGWKLSILFVGKEDEMTIQEMNKAVKFNMSEALRKFYSMYPDVIAYPCGITGNGKLLVSVDDGYHVIDENTISRFYRDAATAESDNM